jgi:hypothetical protein
MIAGFLDMYSNPLQGKFGRSPAGFPRYYFNTFQVKKFSQSINRLQKIHSTQSPTRCFSQMAMLFSASIRGYPL